MKWSDLMRWLLGEALYWLTLGAVLMAIAWAVYQQFGAWWR